MSSMSTMNVPQQWQMAHAASAQSFMVGLDEQSFSAQQAFGFPAQTWMCDPMQACVDERGFSGACVPPPMSTPSTYVTSTGLTCSSLLSPVHFLRQGYGEATETARPLQTFSCQRTDTMSLPCHASDVRFTRPCPSSMHSAMPSSCSTREAQRPFLIDLSSRLTLNLEDCQLSPLRGTEAMTPLASGLCTPEITPRHHAFETMPTESLSAYMVSEAVTQPVHAGNSTERCRESAADVFSEYDSSDDERDNVCWDFDIHSALLIRAQRDSNSYASSETSTAVSCSRSSRRRRGRRVAKGKARSSMAILESPPIDEVLVTEARKVELIQQLEMEGEPMRTAVSNILGSVLQMSLEPFGCRVIQSALDVAGMAEKEAMAVELHDNVRLVTTSPHANFVLQKLIEVLPVSSTTFVAEELKDIAADVAQHRFGCRVLSRLVEHHLCGDAASPATNALIDELLLETDLVIRHNFARHVLELVLEHGSEAHKHSIAETIQANVFYLAKNRCASYVLEKALGLCSGKDIGIIVSALVADPKQFLALAMHECGMHVARAAVRSSSEHAQIAKDMLLENVQQIKSSKYGKRLLDEIGHVEC